MVIRKDIHDDSMKKISRIIRTSLKEIKPRPRKGNWFEKFTTGEYIIPYTHMFNHANRKIFTKGRRYKIIDAGSINNIGDWEVNVKVDYGLTWTLLDDGLLQNFYLSTKKTYGKETKIHRRKN